MRKATVLVLLLALLGVAVAATVLNTYKVPGEGSVKGPALKLYSDVALTQELTNTSKLIYSPVDRGGNTTNTIYIKNVGNNWGILTMITGNWTPVEATTYITITWNRDGYNLTAGNSIDATITLAAGASAPYGTSFSFDMLVQVSDS